MQLSILILSLSYLLASPINNPQPTGYIIKLKSQDGQAKMSSFVTQFSERSGSISTESVQNRIKYKYNPKLFNAIAGQFTDEFMAEFKRTHANDIEYIEEDGTMYALGQQDKPPSWGLTRVSERDLDLTKPYLYADQAGKGVDVYIIDTGIDPSIADYGGRATMAKSFVTGEDPVDKNGHGSHVTGTIGSNKYGIAKQAKLFGVKVLNGQGSGTYSDVIAGINFVAEQKKANPKAKIVSNMSLGGPKSQAVNDAIDAAVDAGVVMIVAAGNDGRDACNLSPAGASKVFAVGASDKTDKMASFSSRGKCLKLFAPGVDITSVWINGQATNTISGTSMASPHVAGVAALLLSQKDYASSKAVYADLISLATKSKITGADAASPNLLLFNNANTRRKTKPTKPIPALVEEETNEV